MAGTLWIQGSERLPCSLSGGTITSTAGPRVVWHTVQGTNWSDAIRTLNGKHAEPHVLWHPKTDRIGQFMPLNLSGRALKNDTDGFRNNRCGKVCIQIEVLGFAEHPFTDDWHPGPNFRAFMAALRSWGIPDVQPAGKFPIFIASPPHNVPENDRDRATWRSKAGHYSHSQIPGNDHGDPGGVSFPKILAAAPRTSTPGGGTGIPPASDNTEEDVALTTEDKAWIESRIQAYALYVTENRRQTMDDQANAVWAAPLGGTSAGGMLVQIRDDVDDGTTATTRAAVQPLADLSATQAKVAAPEVPDEIAHLVSPLGEPNPEQPDGSRLP